MQMLLDEEIEPKKHDEDSTGPAVKTARISFLKEARNAMHCEDFHMVHDEDNDHMEHFRIRPGTRFQLQELDHPGDQE